MLNNHIGLIILGIILDLGGGPDHDRLGFRYWNNPGPFVQYNGIAGAKGRFLGFWAVMSQAAFSFIGTEIVAVSLPLSVHNAAQSHRVGIETM
jgi:yeast amino acid transporter